MPSAIENKLLMSMKTVGKAMKSIIIRGVDCFVLFGAHQHDIIIQIYSSMITMKQSTIFSKVN